MTLRSVDGVGVAPAITIRSYIWPWLITPIVVVLAGLRFNDGSMLLAMARGGTIADPAFSAVGSQYVWDSPLKVFLLRHLIPANILCIGAVFLALALVPLCGLLARSERARGLTAVVLLLTPALKISLQNIGVGDGLVLALTLLLCLARNAALGGLALCALLAWHPQQACVIAASHLVARFCYQGHIEREQWLATLSALLAGCGVYFLYRGTLGFSYAGRMDYLASMYPQLVTRNIAYAAVAFAPMLAWFAFARPSPQRGVPLLVAWLAFCAALSWLCTDVTRVMTLISLPIVCEAVLNAPALEDKLRPPQVAVWAIALALFPAYSWSGLDLLVWTDLLADGCRWAAVCY